MSQFLSNEQVRLALCREAVGAQERTEALARRLFEVQLGAQLLAEQLALKDAKLEAQIKANLQLQRENAALAADKIELEERLRVLEYRQRAGGQTLRLVA